MRLTQRGRRVIMAAGMALGLLAGMTAQHWNPITRQLDRCAGERFEDGSALVRCDGVRLVVHNDPATDR